MATNFKTDATRSQKQFSKFVEPALLAFGFTDIVSTESHDSELARFLDYAGVDALARQKNGATVTIASRIIQIKPNGNDYNCFSIRDTRRNGQATELEKLQHAIKRNSLRPYFHCQTFVDYEKEEAIVSLVRTAPLVQFVVDYPSFKDTCDGAKFRLAYWQDLLLAGVNVSTLKIDANGKKIAA